MFPCAAAWLQSISRNAAGTMSGCPPAAASRSRAARSSAVGASLVGAGMLSVLLYPLVATRIAGPGEPVDAETASAAAEAVTEY